MSKLECGCVMPDHRPGGEFLLFAGDTLLGRSELEWEDEGEGVWWRAGSFTPVEAYYRLQKLFQGYTDELAAFRLASVDYNREVREKLEKQIEVLHLRLVHPDGTEIPVAAFELQDCADTLTEDPRELQVEIRDRLIHDKYFSQPES